eukprot:g2933.t1
MIKMSGDAAVCVFNSFSGLVILQEMNSSVKFWSTIAPASDGHEMSNTVVHKIAAPGEGMLHVTGLSFMALPTTPKHPQKPTAPTFVYAQLGNQQVVIACLTWGVCETLRVELFFERTVTFFVSENGSPVQLTGCVLGRVDSEEVVSEAASDSEEENDSAENGNENEKRKWATKADSGPPSKRPRTNSESASSSGSSGSSDDSSDDNDSSSSDEGDVASPGDKLFGVVRVAMKSGRRTIHIEDIARAYKDKFSVGFRDESGQKLGKFMKKDPRFSTTGSGQWKVTSS